MNGAGSARASARWHRGRARCGRRRPPARRRAAAPARRHWRCARRCRRPSRPAPITAARRISMASDRFEHGGDALAAADAHGRQRQRLAVPPQERGRLAGDPGTAGAQRMPERDGAAVEVEAALVDAQVRTTASACAANASLSSITSMSASRRPARSSAFCAAGTGPIPMISGAHPATAMLRTRASASQTMRARELGRGHQHGRCAVGQRRAGAGRHRAGRIERRLQLGQLLDAWCRLGCSRRSRPWRRRRGSARSRPPAARRPVPRPPCAGSLRRTPPGRARAI